MLSMTPSLCSRLAERLAEDLGRDDLSTAVLKGRLGSACWIAKQAGCSEEDHHGSWVALPLLSGSGCLD